MTEPNILPEGPLRAVLAEGAALVAPGPFPADAVLAGARRRVARTRALGAAAGVLVLAGVVTGITLGVGSGRAGGPSTGPGPGPATGPKPVPATTPPWTPPTWTTVKGLAAGQTVFHDRHAPYGDDPAHVILSGTVDGEPWQLTAGAVHDPTVDQQVWAQMSGGNPNMYCDYMHLEVGSQLSSGGGGCGLVPDLGPVTSTTMMAEHSDGPWAGGSASSGFVRVPDGTARVLLVMPDGRQVASTPVATSFGEAPIAVFPLAPAGPWTVRAYDAAGNELGIYSDTPAEVSEIYGTPTDTPPQS